MQFFEGWVITEVIKFYANRGIKAPIYFWRDHAGIEIDLLIETAKGVVLVEIKSSATFSQSFLKNITIVEKDMPDINHRYIIYAGEQSFTMDNIDIIAWCDLYKLLAVLA